MPHLVQLTIGHQDRYSRGMGCLGAIFFLGRFIALIPVLIWLGILGFVIGIVAWIMQIVVVLSGHLPQGRPPVRDRLPAAQGKDLRRGCTGWSTSTPAYSTKP